MLFVLSSLLSMAQNIKASISNIRSAKGQIMISVFKDNAGFQAQKAYKQFRFDKKDISNGSMTVNFSLEPGVYGIAMLDDENKNGKMEKNFLGMPKEGFGFSNFYLTKLKKPTFDEFKVTLKAQDQVGIKVKYL